MNAGSHLSHGVQPSRILETLIFLTNVVKSTASAKGNIHFHDEPLKSFRSCSQVEAGYSQVDCDCLQDVCLCAFVHPAVFCLALMGGAHTVKVSFTLLLVTNIEQSPTFSNRFMYQ